MSSRSRSHGRLALIAVPLLTGCSLNPELHLAEVALSATAVENSGVPFHPQEEHHCGPASLLSLLEAAGSQPAYQDIVDLVYVPGLEGSLQVEMQAAARSFGYVVYSLPPEPEAVLREVESGKPVLVLLNLGVPSRPVWHYALVIGFDPQRNEMILHSGVEAASRQKAPAWLRRWHWGGRWAMVLLQPGEWPATADRVRLLRALSGFDETASAALAEQAWQTAVDHWPTEAIAWLGLGNARFRQQDMTGSIDAFRRALAANPDSLPARLNLATALLESGAPCAARELVDVEIAPDHSLHSASAELKHAVRNGCDAAVLRNGPPKPAEGSR